MMKFFRNPGLIVIFISLVMLWACNDNIVFEKSERIPADGWHMDNKFVFEHEINDTTLLHDMFINIRNNTSYPYSNFFLFFHTEFPDGRIFKDTIEMTLADRQGRWTGRGTGSVRANSFHFRRDVWFPEPGVYQFTMQHAMRTETLKGITDIGLRIEEK